eukprot:Opistho-1_new@69660
MNYDSITLNFWKEAVDREKRISLGWYLAHQNESSAKGGKVKGKSSPAPMDAAEAAAAADTATWNNKTSYELSVILGRRRKAQETHAQMLQKQPARLATVDYETMAALKDSIRSTKHVMRKQNYGESCQGAEAVIHGRTTLASTYNTMNGTSEPSRILPPTPFATRPASAKTQKLLYMGISAEGEGRAAYLRRRREAMPQEKYVLPVLSNQAYGWEPYLPASPEKGRSKIVHDTFYRKNGVF